MGEFGVLTNEARTATVHAIRKSNLVKVSPELFWQLSKKYPSFIGKITRIIVERQQRLLRGVGSTPGGAHSLALIPGDDSVDTSSFASELATTLGQFGRAIALSERRFEELFGKEGAAQITSDDPSYPAVVNWLSQMESENDFVLFVADSQPSPGSSRPGRV